ncbi:hypothetical protein [Streptomyces mirabilis]|uniref:hypothetical protein n=1 Tax=Streptomyces mirabilis TaxID=68239 RepID=UPI0036DE8B4B
MQDPSLAWLVPFSTRLLPDGAIAPRLAAASAHDAWSVVAEAKRRAGEGLRHRYAYGTTLLCAGLPFAATDVLAGAEKEAKKRCTEGRDPDSDQLMLAIRVDLATASVRCGFWMSAMQQLMKVAEELNRSGRTAGMEWDDLAFRCQMLYRALFVQDQERTFYRLRAAWFEELSDHDQASAEQRLEHAKARQALGALNHRIADYDAAAALFFELRKDPAVGATALELLVGLHLAVGAREPAEREEARRELHRLKPQSAVLRAGVTTNPGVRWLHDLEAYHAASLLLDVSRAAGEADLGEQSRSRLFLLARAYPDQSRCVALSTLAYSDAGLRSQAQEALSLAQEPLTTLLSASSWLPPAPPPLGRHVEGE